MRQCFIDTAEDRQWLCDTALRSVALPTDWQSWQFAIVQGNEDAPYAINLYRAHEPNYDDDYLRVVFEPLLIAEYNGKTDQPKSK